MRGIIIFGVLIAIFFFAFVKAELELTQVQVLFRHGERTPRFAEIYRNDIYNISAYEPWGVGQLTNTGKMREYKIGEILKTQYRNLLGSLYLPHDIRAVSTDYDRTKASLQLVLAGLFPPSEAERWHPELAWIPIPIHSVPRDLDAVLLANDCPRVLNAVSEAWQLPEVRDRLASHENLFEFLRTHTGENITTVKRVYEIFNLLVSQKAMNLTLPKWCTDDVLQEMSEMAVFIYEIWAYTPEIRRLNGGHIVKAFIENMHLNKTQENPRKMYLYSAHESTVAAFMRAQGFLEPRIPHYGTAVMFEKLRDEDGKIFVRFILWTGVTEEIITLRLPGCEEICPIEKYLQLTKEVIPSDEEGECHWRRLSPSQLRKAFDERPNSDN